MPNWSAWALLSVLILPTCSFAADKTLNITVVADHTKANGEPWDGLPGLGGGRGPTAIPIPNTYRTWPFALFAWKRLRNAA